MDFKETIEKLYMDIMSSMDSMCKIENIKRCKYFLGLKEEEYLGDYYYKAICGENNGVVYTPPNIVSFMIRNTVADEVLNNPYIKILDPSCGSGNILIGVFLYLKEIYEENIDLINKRHNLTIKKENISRHIIDNNMFGIDIDEMALKIFAIELFLKAGHVNKSNLIHRDFLIEEIEDKFDIIIGNPPYIGTRELKKEYSHILRKQYTDVFNDKGDISYCFFVKALKCVRSGYKITFITSRYFMESLSGIKLRHYLLSQSNIHRILDFYGVRPFKNTGIDPAIIFLGSSSANEVIVNKPLTEEKVKSIVKDYNFSTIYIERESLNEEPWRLHSKEHLHLVNKIEKRCKKRLGDICDSYQGIITGLDKAFIVTENTIEEHKIERELLKPWIKNSNITKTQVMSSALYIIYSNLITEEDQYPNAIRYIAEHKERLKRRRECVLGRRKWYELQWGREKELFEREKVIFPFKCSENRFVADTGNYFSADIYALTVKSEADLNYKFIQRILNSSLYEFYFKTFAKKLGGSLYEYYPNNLRRLYIPTEIILQTDDEEEIYEYFSLSKGDIDYLGMMHRKPIQ